MVLISRIWVKQNGASLADNKVFPELLPTIDAMLSAEADTLWITQTITLAKIPPEYSIHRSPSPSHQAQATHRDDS